LIAPSWVGDAILSEPLVATVREAGVAQPIDVVAPPWCGPVYARMRGLGEIFGAPASHGELGFHARRAFGRSLRARRYTHAYVLPNTWKSALVPFYARIPVRVGYVGEMRYGLLTDARRIDRRLPQLAARYASLAVARGATLAQRLAQDGHAIWILGSPNDRDVARALIAALPASCTHVVDLTGRTDLGTAIDLLSVASIVISNDSGLMHAAAAVDAPLVALFGSSSPAYTPPASELARIARIDIACSPCFKRECPLGHFRCMRDLSPELVYNLARTTPQTTPSVRSR